MIDGRLMGDPAREILVRRPVAHSGYQGLSWVSGPELGWLLGRLSEEKGVLLIEVGTASGVTAALIAAARPRLTVISVDPFPDHGEDHVLVHEPCRVDNWRRNHRWSNQILWLGSFESFQKLTGIKADVLFLDAGHDRVDVSNDLKIARESILPGGSIYLHDYYEPRLPGVREAADEFIAKGVFQITDSFGTIVELIKSGE